MANLKTLDGISDAREKLYNDLENKEIDDKRALAQERVLRGQTELKATIPLRLVSIIARAKNPKVQEYAEPLLRSINKFVTGEDLPKIEESK